MVHPNVLKEGGIDPQIYSGWAFGFGVERVAMMRGGVSIPDLRVIYSGELGFLTQF
jgi:phenylalanyl-tRNA synthetase alpha chain